MINKILWASDGSKDSTEAIKYLELIAGKFGTEIIGSYILPDYYELEMTKDFPATKSDLIAKFIGETESKHTERLNRVARNFRGKGIKFKVEIGRGAPHSEILRIANKEKADMIFLGRGRASEKFILGATSLKVLRRSSIPVLTTKVERKNSEIKKILVPLDQYHLASNDLRFAVKLSKAFGADIYCLNIIEIGEHKFPAAMLKHKLGSISKKIEGNILVKFRKSDNIKTFVQTAKNAWVGINEFVREKDTDLIIMMTYAGDEFRKEEFMGSITERVVQEAQCPVITMRPEYQYKGV
jgi:nucleotide-binding universal stress UspA family protein